MIISYILVAHEGKKIMQKHFFYFQGFADKSFKRSERKMTLVIKGILLYIYFLQ